MHRVQYNSPNRLIAGSRLPVRVNLSFGLEMLKAVGRESAKVKRLLSAETRPDLMMDLSVERADREPWQVARELFDGPLGLLPHYLLFSSSDGLDAEGLLARIESVFKLGINFITIHCTPTLALFEKAKRERLTPITSRGGGIVVRDMLINGRSRSLFVQIFDDICGIAAHYGGVINLGTAFRAASVADGLDAIVREEIAIQAQFVHRARELGAQVVLEGPGHIRLSELSDYWTLIAPLKVTPMPLGPIVSDRFSGMDHVSSAIGAARFMSLSRGGIINAVTAAEHLGGVPNLRQMEEGLRAAQVAAQAASLDFDDAAFEAEAEISQRRANLESCVLQTQTAGCSRCQRLCPLISASYSCEARN
ncbi:phosphomethylpyrimidine synthase ThiC [Novosphingobium sp. YJ-S2-02]|uniref:Phosphomethylpyrimidine synthase ThiC n=1 Tax=Novosphingobium aureum TaxID=2792964 RepID=A0A931H9G2_9SPHN|nr:phosphomethylpyrimidine synthase ThiC [Novosphingobium aureum]MBH0111634.1 phosphomethylpyrimidine synthase ThiC [Novosphingobium aureum]